jgi:hypothetical protein
MGGLREEVMMAGDVAVSTALHAPHFEGGLESLSMFRSCHLAVVIVAIGSKSQMM